MSRRAFITLVVAAASLGTWTDRLSAQGSQIPSVGILATVTPPECLSPEAYRKPVCTIETDMRELGWREGENVRFYKPFGTGDVAILPRLASELVALHPDVLIAIGSTEAKALQT